MSGEQNPHRNAINSARCDKAKGHQTRRARGGKKQKRRQDIRLDEQKPTSVCA
jgi:hypothetical protein